jgi:hypothetical protein
VRERDAPWSHYFWLSADVVLLTALLANLDTRLGALLGSYLALVCVSGLFFQPRLVAFTTLLATAAAAVLFALRPDEAAPLHNAFLYLTSVVMTGFVVGYQVWRMNVLREYYDDRRRVNGEGKP